jgi:hypothetical protein
MAPFAPVQLPHDRLERIEMLGVRLAEFAVEHPNVRFAPEEILDAQLLLPYLRPYTVEIVSPFTTDLLPELQLYLDCNIVTNLTKLLEGLVHVCFPTHLHGDCKKGLAVYWSAFSALTRIAEQARALATQPEGKAIARKVLDQLQPENREQAPGMP